MRDSHAFEHMILATLAAVLVIVVLGIAVSSCSGGDQSSQDQQSTQAAQDQTTQTTRQLKSADSVKSRKALFKAVDSASSKKLLSTFNSTYSLDSQAGHELSQQVDKVTSKYRLSFVMVDLKTGEGISYNPSQDFYSASAIKGPYVVSANKYLSSEIGKSEESLMESAIIDSDNHDYIELRDELGSACMRKYMKYCDISTQDYYKHYSYFTAREFAHLWIGNYYYFFEDTNKRSEWCRNLYTHGYRSFIHKKLKDTTTVYTKPGWFPGEGYNVQNDAGIVMANLEGEERPYVLVVFSTACGKYKMLGNLVSAIDAVHTDMSYAD